MYMFSYMCTVVGSLVVRMLKDPLYQNIEPDLSELKGRQIDDEYGDEYGDLNDIIAGLLEPYNAGDPGVADKLIGLYYVHYNITSLYWS